MEGYEDGGAGRTTADDGQVGVHLFVMVHGFQGNHNDMRLFKN